MQTTMASVLRTAITRRPPAARAQMARMWAGSSSARRALGIVLTQPGQVVVPGWQAAGRVRQGLGGHGVTRRRVLRVVNVPPLARSRHDSGLVRFAMRGLTALVEGTAGTHQDRQLVV